VWPKVELSRIVGPGGGRGHAGALQVRQVGGLVQREYRLAGRHQAQTQVAVRVDRHLVSEHTGANSQYGNVEKLRR